MRSIREILESSITVAVVGASPNPEKAAHQIPLALQHLGFRIIPVNPTVNEVFGQKAYASIRDIPEHVDIVDVFRRPADVPPIAHEAVAIGASALWLQSGIRSDEAKRIAEAGGIDYVEDKCLKVEAMTRSINKNATD